VVLSFGAQHAPAELCALFQPRVHVLTRLQLRFHHLDNAQRRRAEQEAHTWK
jgi:hypothetical protein